MHTDNKFNCNFTLKYRNPYLSYTYLDQLGVIVTDINKFNPSGLSDKLYSDSIRMDKITKTILITQ